MAANQPSLLRVRRSLRSFPASNRSPGCRESCARTAAEEICRRPTNSREATMKIPLAVGLRTAEAGARRSEEHTSELQSRLHLVCRLLLEKKKRLPLEPHRSPSPHRRPVVHRRLSPIPASISEHVSSPSPCISLHSVPMNPYSHRLDQLSV